MFYLLNERKTEKQKNKARVQLRRSERIIEGRDKLRIKEGKMKD